jgi:hypothetical protein
MNDEIVELFEKTAAAEGIDLDDMSDEDLAALYEHYVENVLPVQLGDDYDYDDAEKVADAQEKLAEAEILGRHMARAYLAELEKEAAGEQIFSRTGGLRTDTPTQADYEAMFGKGSKKTSKKDMDANREAVQKSRKGAVLRMDATGNKSKGGATTSFEAELGDVAPKGAKYKVDKNTGEVIGPDVVARKTQSTRASRKNQKARTDALRARADSRKFDIYKYRAGRGMRAVGQHLSRNRLAYGAAAALPFMAGGGYLAGQSMGQDKRASLYDDSPDTFAIKLAAHTLSDAYDVDYYDAADDLCKVASANETALITLADLDIDEAAAFLLTQLGVSL